MLIKAKVSCSGESFSLAPEHEYELTDAIAKDLIQAGYADEVVKPAVTKKTTKKAEAKGNA